MIQLLIPLGLLGLLSIIVLIIIYIIKPNYQQKSISSTFMWRLSLKYRKKQIPVSKLRNLLLIICQILILTACALMLAEPIIRTQAVEQMDEKIVIIEASANMKASHMTEDNYRETRFEKAVNMVKELSEEVLSNDKGVISIILAGQKAEVLLQTVTDIDTVIQTLDDLLENDVCTYHSADIDGAMGLAEEILNIRPLSEVMLYTATEYLAPGDVTIVNVRENSEWNAAILNVKAEVNAKLFYTFTVEVGLYGIDGEVEIAFEVYNVDAPSDEPDGGRFVSHVMTVELSNDQSGTFTWNSGEGSIDDYDSPEEDSIMIFSSADVYVRRVNEVVFNYLDGTTENDSFDEDNRFIVYGERKQILRVEYVSTLPNPFINAMIGAWRSAESEDWEFSVKEVNVNERLQNPVTPEYEGYHIYIFEHMMPTKMPQDGLVIILDPPEGAKSNRYIPSYWGIRFGDVKERDTFYHFEAGDPHPITSRIEPEKFEVMSFTSIKSSDADFEELMYVADEPVLLVKNSDADGEKIVLFSYNVNYANPLVYEFNYLMLDLFEYFFPGTISDYLYTIGDTVSFRSLSNNMTLEAPNMEFGEVFTQFPASYVVDVPGAYTLRQQFLGTVMETRFFVKMPDGESNTMRVVEDLLDGPMHMMPETNLDTDLLLYFAAAFIALMFLEWFLQSKNQM